MNLEQNNWGREQVNDLEDGMVEITATEQNIEQRMKRNEDTLRDPWDNMKCINIHIIGVPEGEERGKGPEKIFEEIIAENLLNLEKERVNQVQGNTESPRQDKLQEEHTNTHSNQTDEN